MCSDLIGNGAEFLQLLGMRGRRGGLQSPLGPRIWFAVERCRVIRERYIGVYTMESYKLVYKIYTSCLTKLCF